ncbi:unnamed protein product [Urochloa humidicola]
MSMLGNQTLTVSPAVALGKIWRPPRADGPASVLGIGTAKPAHCVRQEDFADYYFRVTKSEHLPDLKAKLKRICHKSAIKKRYFHHTEDLLRDHPEFLDPAAPSLDARLDIVAAAVPELTAAAAAKAIVEWGRPATDITHLVVATYSGAHMPGADHRLASLLGLRPSVRRTVLYMNGCSSGAAALRVAKDLAENTRGARVLVACAELTLVLFRAPRERDAATLVMQSMFGDGAGAVVVGAGPSAGSGERPAFEMVSASQAVIPETTGSAAVGRLREDGLLFEPSKEMPSLVRDNIERCVTDALEPVGISGGWNDLFWAVHPGGRAILDSVEAGLRLEARKLAASRRVLSEYGNLSGPAVIFVLDELRRRQESRIGVMLVLGPGVSVETMVLRAAGCEKKN